VMHMRTRENGACGGDTNYVRYAVEFSEIIGDDEIKNLRRRARLLRELAELAETHTSSNEEVRERAERLRRLADIYEKFGGEQNGRLGERNSANASSAEPIQSDGVS